MDTKYILTLLVFLMVSILYNNYKGNTDKDEAEKHYDLVREYLLNDSALAQNKLPIIWIHMTYDINARDWPSFYSRNTCDLNQPYQYLTVKSIIDKCGNDFNICLIDDNSFEKILPEWNINLKLVAEPIRSKIRKLALSKTLYQYGGMLVPGSFICKSNLKPLYDNMTGNNMMFAGEMMDRNSTSDRVNFFPSTKIMGCNKKCNKMLELINSMEQIIAKDYTDESNFTGEFDRWLYKNKDNINIVSARLLGIKDYNNNPIVIEQLLGSSYIDLCDNAFGVYIPDNEILNRTAYQWFARLSPGQVLESDTMIGKLLVANQ